MSTPLKIKQVETYNKSEICVRLNILEKFLWLVCVWWAGYNFVYTPTVLDGCALSASRIYVDHRFLGGIGCSGENILIPNAAQHGI